MSRRKKRSRIKNGGRYYDGSATQTRDSSVSVSPVAGPSGPTSPAAALGATDRGPQEVRNLPVPVFAADAPHHQVLDEDGHPVFVSDEDARRLQKEGRATFHKVTRHLKGIRVIPEVLRSPQRAGSIREGSVIDPTDAAGIDNVRGNWAWNAPIFRRRDGNSVREPATTRTFRALPRHVEDALLEERRRFFAKLAA